MQSEEISKENSKEIAETVHEHNQKQTSNQIQTFNNTEFGSIRTLEENGKILFCGTDIAKALGYLDTPKAIKAHCKEDGWMIYPVIDNLGRQQQAKFITEGNVYRLITHSKLPTAEKFEKWVFDDVLPAIRKHGTYMTPETIEKMLYNPDFLIQLVNTLKLEQEKNRKLLAESQKLESENQNLKTTNKALSGEIQNWDYKLLIRKLINVYSAKVANGFFGVGWNHYYDELLYKQGINLKSRKTKSKTSKSCLDFLSQDEVEIAVKTAIAMCENFGIKASDILNRHISKIRG